MDALTLLSGDAQTFLDKVWASRVHLHQAAPEELTGLLSLDDVDHLLTSTGLRTPALRVVQDGSVLPASAFTRSASLAGAPLSGLVDARKVLDLFDGGATVVLQGLHRYWQPLTDLVRGLELALGHPCQANAYLTPPGSQGFARHSDSHDVFVFQTHGHKLWEVVEGDADQGEEREVLLEPGLSMYLPTGTPHSARSQEQPSLHVTVGINRTTVREVLRELTDRVLGDPRYDAPLPAGWLDDPQLVSDRLAEELTALTGALADSDTEELVRRRSDGFRTGRVPYLRHGLTDLVGLAAIEDATRLSRRPTAACVIEPGPDRLRVFLGDRELRMPVRLAQAMEFVRAHESFTVRQLEPWLDPQSRLVLTRRLVREGLLRIDT